MRSPLAMFLVRKNHLRQSKHELSDRELWNMPQTEFDRIVKLEQARDDFDPNVNFCAVCGKIGQTQTAYGTWVCRDHYSAKGTITNLFAETLPEAVERNNAAIYLHLRAIQKAFFELKITECPICHEVGCHAKGCKFEQFAELVQHVSTDTLSLE